MKKLILLVAACLMAGLSVASTYDRLLIQAKDGSETYVFSQNLHMSVAGDNLVVSHSGGTTNLAIPELASMEFLNDNAHIEDILSSDDNDILIYTLQGRYAGRFHSVEDAIGNMADAGVYVIVAKSGTVKIFIEK